MFSKNRFFFLKNLVFIFILLDLWIIGNLFFIFYLINFILWSVCIFKN